MGPGSWVIDQSLTSLSGTPSSSFASVAVQQPGWQHSLAAQLDELGAASDSCLRGSVGRVLLAAPTLRTQTLPIAALCVPEM